MKKIKAREMAEFWFNSTSRIDWQDITLAQVEEDMESAKMYDDNFPEYLSPEEIFHELKLLIEEYDRINSDIKG